MPLKPRASLGPYEVVAPLGAGGMGEVYRARDPRLGRDVAVKILPTEGTGSPERLRRFEDEARAAGALNHPNILSVLDVGTEGGAPYVVFELLEGETLRERLDQGPLPFRKAVEYAVQICNGLGAAHGKGIVHRDLKPSNLFLTEDGRAKILDFGLAKLTEDSTPVGSHIATRTATTPGVLVGTFAYMSPEQAREQAADARSDLFALGATLHEMLSGRPAFQRATAAETLGAILNHDPGAVGVTADGPIPPALEQIVRRCLEKNPEERFQSARDLGFALAALSSLTPGSMTAVPAPFVPRWRWALSVFALLLVVAGIWAALRARDRFGAARNGVAGAPMTAVPFTSFPGLEYAPTFSPDGSQIAFAWGGGGKEGDDLYVKVIGSEKLLRLTNHPADWIIPAWSPDGRQIAFSRWSKTGSGVYLIPALGGPERKVAEMRSNFMISGLLSWSPDGKTLAHTGFEKSRAAQTVTLLDVDTLAEQSIPSPSERCQGTWVPAFSPDGRSLAFACPVSVGVDEIFVMPLQGGPARKLALAKGDFTGLTYSADGERLTFASDGDLWQLPVAGGAAEKLLSALGAELPTVSRTGKRLAYNQRIINSNIWRVPLASPDRSGAPAEPLVSSSRSQAGPDFSPDGRRIAFISDRSGRLEIWTCDADGSNPVRLTFLEAPATGSARWSPDSRRIVFDSRASGESGIYVIRADGGPAQLVATGIADSTTPTWSIDGKWLFFSGLVDGANQIFKVRPEGGASIQLTRGGGLRPRESPDGRRVYYQQGPVATIRSASVEGGDEQDVTGLPARIGPFPEDWAVTPLGLYFITGKPPRAGVELFEFSTGKVRRVLDIAGTPEPWIGGLAVSPDGRSLLYSQRDGISGDIMLVDGLP